MLRAGERKALEDAAVIRLDGTRDELGIPDPVRADRCDLDALRGQLPAKSPAVAQQEGLGGGICRKIGDGLESCTGADFQDMGSGRHERDGQLGHGDGCPAVEIDHTARRFHTNLGAGANASKSGRIDEPADLDAFHSHQLLLDGGKYGGVRQVADQEAAG